MAPNDTEEFLHQLSARRSKKKGSESPVDTMKPTRVREQEAEIKAGKLECEICFDPVGRKDSVWSCQSGCFCIFHLWCMYKWAIQCPSKTSNWTCPNCRATQITPADALHYTCFCGRVKDPPPNTNITPHACGGHCSKPGSCAHTLQCPLLCHPGPCPPCTALQTCPCGKVTTAQCPQRPRLVTCGQQCGKPLPCGHHKCQQICHEGACKPCDLSLQFCDCGKSNRRDLGLGCAAPVAKCHEPCGKLLECGAHPCPWGCHKPGKCRPHCSVPVDHKCQCGATTRTDSCHCSEKVFWCRYKVCQKMRQRWHVR